jgi:hypothetical protein
VGQVNDDLRAAVKHGTVDGLTVCAKKQLVRHLSKQMRGKLLKCENSEKTRQNEKEGQRCESSRMGERVHGWDKDHPY